MEPATAEVTVTLPDGAQRSFVGPGQTEIIVQRPLPQGFQGYYVEANAREGSVGRWIRPWRMGDEFEPNDTQNEAVPLRSAGARTGGLDPLPNGSWESDWFSTDASVDGGLSILLRSFMCPEGLLFEVSGPQLPNILRFRTGPDQVCPRMYGPVPGAGTYWIRVSMDGPNPNPNPSFIPYTLLVQALPPICGDNRRTPPETCDDGNRISGDGCSSACETEYDVQTTTSLPPLLEDEPLALWPLAGQDVEDEGLSVVVFSRPFHFFGQRYMGAFVSTNGYISFTPPEGTVADARQPFGPATPNGLIGLFVNDLQMQPGGQIRTGTTNGSDVVINFQGFGLKNDSASRLSGNIQLRNDGLALHYDSDITGRPTGGGVAAGIEDGRGRQMVSACGTDNLCTIDALRGQSFHFRLQ